MLFYGIMDPLDILHCIVIADVSVYADYIAMNIVLLVHHDSLNATVCS